MTPYPMAFQYNLNCTGFAIDCNPYQLLQTVRQLNPANKLTHIHKEMIFSSSTIGAFIIMNIIKFVECCECHMIYGTIVFSYCKVAELACVILSTFFYHVLTNHECCCEASNIHWV